jgi:hypothetical protein
MFAFGADGVVVILRQPLGSSTAGVARVGVDWGLNAAGADAEEVVLAGAIDAEPTVGLVTVTGLVASGSASDTGTIPFG